MTRTSLPAFAELEQALNNTTFTLHPSEAHGLVCGILCGEKTNEAWGPIVTGDKQEEVHPSLQAAYDATNQQLMDFEFELELLLPLDTEDLTTRAKALTLWCQGFLTGLQRANIPVSNREPGDMTEAITDLIEIAKMNYEEVISSEEDEAAYVELIEFVRMAVILIYQEVHEKAGQDTALMSPTNLH